MDYSKFYFPPFAEDTITELEKFPEFQFKSKDKDKIINFIILCWDVNNIELRRLYPEYYTRKREAALLAGFQTDKTGRFEKNIEDILTGQNDQCNTASVRYLLLQGLPDYPALIAQRELQAKELEAAFQSKDPKDRKIIRENIDKSTERIAEYEAKIFGGQEVENVRKALYKHIESEKLRLRPEYIAEDTAAKKLKFKKNPFYGN